MLCARKHFLIPATVLAVAAAMLLVAVIVPVPASAAPTENTPPTETEIVSEEVTVESGDLTLDGTLIMPEEHDADLPGLVMITGAGGMREDYTAEAQEFARSGMAVLTYDKRPEWPALSFARLAEDALAAVDLLRAHQDTDPDRVGVWGHSEGAWVAPLAAAESTDVAFVVSVAGSSHAPDRSQLWSNRMHLAYAGVREPLLDPMGSHLSRMLVDLDAYGDVDHDTLATAAAVSQPTLAVFAEHDRSVPAGESLPLLHDALDAAGHPHYTLSVIPDADHGMRHNDNGFDVDRSEEFAPGYLDLVTEWVHSLEVAEHVADVDSPPAQEPKSQPVADLSWYEDPGLHVSALGLMLLFFLAYPGTMLVRWVRRRPQDPRASRWWALAASGAGIGAVIGTPAYLFTILMAGATNVTSTVVGRPLPWLALQVATVVVVLGSALVVRGLWRDRSGQARTSSRRGLYLPLLGAALFVPWAAYWGLLTI